MKRGFRRDRCFFMETILGSCWGWWPFCFLRALVLGTALGGPWRAGFAAMGKLVEKAEACWLTDGMSVRATVEVDETPRIDDGGLEKRIANWRMLAVDAILTMFVGVLKK